MRHQQQRPRNTQARIGSVVRDASARVEQPLSIQVDERAAKNGIVPVPEHRNRRAFLYPEKIGHIDAKLFEGRVDAFGFFRPEPRGFEYDHACWHMPMVRSVRRD